MHHKHHGKPLISHIKRKITLGFNCVTKMWNFSIFWEQCARELFCSKKFTYIHIAKSMQHDHSPLASISELIHIYSKNIDIAKSMQHDHWPLAFLSEFIYSKLIRSRIYTFEKFLLRVDIVSHLQVSKNLFVIFYLKY
jgi:hypothetical protein